MIILFGVVGSGKTEQTKRLVDKLHCPYISTSSLIRQKSNPKWEELVMAGNLIPDEDIYSILEPELEKVDAGHKEFILDGAPRSVAQAEWLIRKIRLGQVKLTAIIYLEVSKEAVMQRLLARGRNDDKVEVITQRFEEYDNLTTPVLDFFRGQGYEVSEVDGSRSINEVEDQIWQVLKDKVDAT